MVDKRVTHADLAIADIHEGASIAIGGFGLCGLPENSIAALVYKNIKNLICVSNNASIDDFGIGLLLQNRQIKKLIASYIGENKLLEQMLFNHEIEVEFVPQGTLAEKLRNGGAGIPAFFTPTGAGTVVSEGKEIRKFLGHDCVLEESITTDFAFVKAWKGDSFGNLIFHKTARNFNPLCAMAGRITIAEVEELLPVGALDPDHIHLPGIYVKRIYQGKNYIKPIEKRILRD